MKNRTSAVKQKLLNQAPFAIILFFLAISTTICPYYILRDETQLFLDILIPSVNNTFLIIFCIAYITIKKTNENKAGFGLIYLMVGALLITGFLYPRTLGYTQVSFGIAYMFYISAVISLAVFIYLAFDRNRIIQKQQELEKKNLQSELAVLKNQISPHFLFNTLNNIDSLIKTDTNKASATLVELSGLMRYMIYETRSSTTVPLRQELDYIENYLALQRLQYANTELVEYHVEGNPYNRTIAPMLFIPFIENAFKHCTDKTERHAISFLFGITEQEIRFEACNIFNKKQQINKDQSSGVGLDIIERRLELLYGNKYDWNTEIENDLYKVTLIIYDQN